MRNRTVLRRSGTGLAALALAATGLAALEAPAATAASTPLAAAATTATVAATPYMGWSSWSLQTTSYGNYNSNGSKSFLTEANVMAQAKAMVSDGLTKVGYNYVNIDSGWAIDYSWNNAHLDAYGRPAEDTTRFPDSMQTVASNIHALGLKAGIYLAAGMTQQAYNTNDPVYGSTDGCTTQKATLKDSSGNPVSLHNEWSGYYAMDFSSSNDCGAEYVKSIAQMFTGWGYDLIKLDGITPGSTNNNPSPMTDSSYYEVASWHQALSSLGWGGTLLLSYSLPVSDATYWQQNGNGARIDNDVECYCSTLVNGWTGSLSERWKDVVPWIQYSKPGFWPNLDALDVGNGSLDGLTNDQRQTYMTLWALESAPLYSGDDLTNLDSYGLSLLTNTEVIAQDQNGIPGKPVNQSSNQQVWYTKNADGTVTVALFNLSGSAASVTANWSDVGLSPNQAAQVHDMWSHSDLGSSTGSFSASLPAYGSRLLKLTPGQTQPGPGAPTNVTGYSPSSTSAALSWTAPSDYTSPPSAITSYSVYNGSTLAATVTGTSATITGLSPATTYSFTVKATDAAGYTGPASTPVSVTTLGADGSATYHADAAGNTLAGGAKVQSCSGCSDGNAVGYIGESGTLTFNNVSAPSTGAYQVQIAYVDGDGAGAGRTADISMNGGAATTFTANGNGSWNTPQTTTVTLNLTKGSNTIEFSNPSTWAPDIDTITVSPGTSGGGTGNAATYVADTAGTAAGGAKVQSCSGCADGKVVGYIGEGGTLTFPNVSESAAGTYTMTVTYVDGDSSGNGRQADITVNGGTPIVITANGNGNWTTPQTLTVSVTLKAGTNTIEFSNPSTWAPDIYSINV